MIAVSFYCYLIKFRAKQKHYHLTTEIANEEKFYIKCAIKKESNDKLKYIDIKKRACYYFDDIIKIEDFNLDNILIDKNSYDNILLYNISYQSLIDYKPLRIRFDKTDGFIRVYDGTRYFFIIWK